MATGAELYCDSGRFCAAVAVRKLLFSAEQTRCMNRSTKAIWLFALLPVTSIAAVVGAANAQQSRRSFAPGVLTTIAPAPQAEEMFSGPRPLVELPIAIKGLKYEPKLASASSTVYERSQNA